MMFMIFSKEQSRHFSDSSHLCFCQTSATCLWFSYEEFLNGIQPIVNNFLPVTSDLTKGGSGKAEGKNGYGAFVFVQIHWKSASQKGWSCSPFLLKCMFIFVQEQNRVRIRWLKPKVEVNCLKLGVPVCLQPTFTSGYSICLSADSAQHDVSHLHIGSQCCCWQGQQKWLLCSLFQLPCRSSQVLSPRKLWTA